MSKEKDIYKYLYRRDKPVIIKSLGYIVAIFALLRILDEPIVSFILGLGATGLFAYQSGIEIDFKNNKYRLINSFGPQSFGDWQTLPKMDYISVFSVNLLSSVYGRSGTSVSQKQEVIQVNLIINQNKRLRLLETKDIENAFEFAKDFSAKLDLKIYDATKKEGEWL